MIETEKIVREIEICIKLPKNKYPTKNKPENTNVKAEIHPSIIGVKSLE